ncbi:hypothetical protein [Nocardiopsis gilva]|uniref:hypothetical protein n=1 Tax=Nocardiopsis gilva TaxID=280236 RepID=UPI001E36B0C1|nr:hypothetical protein [Nocardiopsis gilva]
MHITLGIDFEPLSDDVADDFEFAVELAESERVLPPASIQTLGQELDDEWEKEGTGRPVFRARAVVRRAEWHLAGVEDDSVAVAELDRVLGHAACWVVGEVRWALAEERDPRPVGRDVLGRPPALPRDVSGVYVRHVRVSCPPQCAVVWADFMPLPDDGAGDFAFVNDAPAVCRHPGEPLPAEFASAFGDGVREALEVHGSGRPLFAARAVLRDAVWHELDSTAHAFRVAGWLAAIEVRRCILEDREPRPAGSGLRKDASIPPMPRTRTLSTS